MNEWMFSWLVGWMNERNKTAKKKRKNTIFQYYKHIHIHEYSPHTHTILV